MKPGYRVPGYTLLSIGEDLCLGGWSAVARRERAGQRRVVLHAYARLSALSVAARADMPESDVVEPGEDLDRLVRHSSLVIAQDGQISRIALELSKPLMLLLGEKSHERLVEVMDIPCVHVIWRPHATEPIHVEDVLSELLALRSAALDRALRFEDAGNVAKGASAP